MFLLISTCIASATDGYQQPPTDISAILDAARPPSVRFSPDRAWMLELQRPDLPSLAELAEPSLELAGLKINPRTHGPARAAGYTGLVIREVDRPRRAEILARMEGPQLRIRDVAWSPDSRHVAFTNTVDDGVELWVISVDAPEPRRLTGPVLNAAYGTPCDWLPGDRGLVCKVALDGAPPAADPVPHGPRIEQSLGRRAPGRTWQNLLEDDHDEALFEHFLTSQLAHVGLDGVTTALGEPAIVDEATPSPDGRWLLVEAMHAPWSTQVPASRFPRTFEVRSLADDRVVRLADLPLADDVPTAFGSVRTGRRSMGWRADEAATIWWIEALDGGDAGADAPWRDEMSLLAAPFDGTPAPLWRSELRMAGVTWGDAGLALGTSWWWKTRQLRVWQLDPSDPSADPTLHWERSLQDRYSDPGTPLTEPGPFGRSVLRRTGTGQLLLAGDGYSAEGIYPFLDRYDLRQQESTRLWRASDPWHESVVDVLDDEGESFITRRQSASEPPNYQLRRRNKRRARALTEHGDWAPQFAGVHKEVVRYERADGVELSATLYLPPGYDPARSGPLPTVFWAYPFEFKDRSDAGQVTSSPSWFKRPGGSSPLFFLLAGYAVVEGPSMPIIGEGDQEPNDTFREQLVAGARAAVEAFVARGVTDPDRTVIGGHSYGAFMVGNLLAHSDLFRAGIARSGAYNRTLTPFGFQSERRTLWEAPEAYMKVSPLFSAHRLNEPILLIHGEDDANSGTYPLQSKRLFHALKGNGGTARLVMLPHESHGYTSRESVLHVLAESFRWFDTHVKNATPAQDVAPAG